MTDHPAIDITSVERRMVALCGEGPVAKGARYHLGTGGNRIRAQLGLDAASALGLGGDVAVACACGPELLHNASLVHDDLQDRDEMRRGRLAVWCRFGVAEAVCIGDLLISAAYAAMAAHPDPTRAIMLLHETVARTARGQAADLLGFSASLDAYRRMVEHKSGGLIALPVRLALAASAPDADARALDCAGKLAFAYQALDDIADRDADLAAERVNICTLLGGGDTGICQARAAAREALQSARHHARALPAGAGHAFGNLADRMDSRLTEYADAA